MAEGHAQRRWWERVRWRWVAPLAVLVSASIGGWCWFESDADLRAARAAARDHGLATTWSEIAPPPAPPERLVLLRRLLAIAGGTPSWTHTRTVYTSDDGFQPGLPTPQEMIDHHAALNGAALAEIDDLVDQLGLAELVVHDQMVWSTPLPEISPEMDLARLLSERVVVSPRNLVSERAKRALGFARSLPRTISLLATVRGTCLSYVCRAIIVHRDDLADDQELAGQLEACADEIVLEIPRVTAGDLALTFDALADRAHWRQLGDHSALVPLAVRLGRRQLLAEWSEWTFLQRAHAAEPRKLISPPEPDRPAEHRLSLTGFIPNWRDLKLGPMRYDAVNLWLIATQLRLTASFLRGEPWPVDPLDQLGARLRPISRDGVVIGAYSVGRDGVDDGGDQTKDRRWALRAPLVIPTSSGK
jgi:hypothetical protein